MDRVAARRVYLTLEAALRDTVRRMERDPGYRPAWAGPGDQGLERVRQCLQDVRELMKDQRTEGDG